MGRGWGHPTGTHTGTHPEVGKLRHGERWLGGCRSAGKRRGMRGGAGEPLLRGVIFCLFVWFFSILSSFHSANAWLRGEEPSLRLPLTG